MVKGILGVVGSIQMEPWSLIKLTIQAEFISAFFIGGNMRERYVNDS